MNAPDLALTPSDAVPDSAQGTTTPHAIACDLLAQAMRILQNHDPRSQTARAAAGVLVCAVYAVHRQPGEHEEAAPALWAMADTLAEFIRAAPLAAEHPARHLANLVEATRRLENPKRWRPSAAQIKRARLTLELEPGEMLLHHRFTSDGTFQARKTYSDHWTTIPAIIATPATLAAETCEAR